MDITMSSNDSNDSIEIPIMDHSRLTTVTLNGGQQIVHNVQGADLYPLPQVAIIEEPQSRGFRFRYECEGPSHGGLQGTSSERGRKTYPSIKVENYDGPARIEVSLVNVDNDKNHPHKLVGKNCEDGICVMEVRETYGPIQFQNMSVQHVTKKKAVEVLQKRIKNKVLREKMIGMRNLNAAVSLTKEEETEINRLATEQAKSAQLNNVKLCFQVYIQDPETQQCIVALNPVYSNSIHDSKSPGASTLKICRMDKYGGCCTGNEEVFLLCEKVQKEDIAVKFFESDGNVIKWESFGNFGPLDVHRQFAIVFRTPAYFNTHIEKAVNVYIVLQRKSDGETSDPKSFTYYPQNLDKDEIKKKKRKKIPLDYDGFPNYDGSLGGGGGGYNGSNGDDFGSKVIFPNGNIMNNSALPTMVLQAVTQDQDISYPTFPSPYYTGISSDPMLFTNLETDSEPIVTSNSIFATNLSLDDIDGRLSSMKVNEQVFDMKAAPCIDYRPKEALLSRSASGGERVDSISSDTETKKIELPKKDDQVSKAEQTKKVEDEPQVQQKEKKDKISKSTYTSKQESIKIIERTLTAMQDYAETSDIRYLLLVQRHLASVQNKNGDLPIHLAVINDQLPALQSFLGVMSTLPNCNHKVNSFNYLRQTPLHLAVLTKQPAAIELLLHYGADPGIMDRCGNTAANLAVQCNNIPCLKSLLKYLRPGVKATSPFPELNYMNYEGFCPAHIAAQNGNVEILRLLYKGKACLDLPDGKSGRTPLHHAVESDDLSVASYLLMEAETDVNAQCFDGNTPLHIACGRNLVGMVALLITAGADKDIENEEIYDEGYDSESSDGSQSNKIRERRGMKPSDYVKDNEQILRVLFGDLSMSNDDNDLEIDGGDFTPSTKPVKSLTESGLGSLGPILSKGGDLEKVDYKRRIELSDLLDPTDIGKDVYSLADKLGFSHLKNALEGIQTSDTSPTRFLLDYFETYDGTVAQLKTTLTEMGRFDAVSILSHIS